MKNNIITDITKNFNNDDEFQGFIWLSNFQAENGFWFTIKFNTKAYLSFDDIIQLNSIINKYNNQIMSKFWHHHNNNLSSAPICIYIEWDKCILWEFYIDIFCLDIDMFYILQKEIWFLNISLPYNY